MSSARTKHSAVVERRFESQEKVCEQAIKLLIQKATSVASTRCENNARKESDDLSRYADST